MAETTKTCGSLQISPAEVRFPFQLKKFIPVYVHLTNPTDTRLLFKIKTNAPKKYVVRPSSGVVEAKDALQVQIVMQAQGAVPESIKDKFQVLCVQAPKDYDASQAVTPELFSDKAEGYADAILQVAIDQTEGAEDNLTSMQSAVGNMDQVGRGFSGSSTEVQKKLRETEQALQVAKMQGVEKIKGHEDGRISMSGFGIVQVVLALALGFAISHILGMLFKCPKCPDAVCPNILDSNVTASVT